MKDVLRFIKERKWFKIGRWRQPGIVMDIITRAETQKRSDIVLPYEARVYLHGTDFGQSITEEDYENIYAKIKRDLLAQPKAISKRIKHEIYASIRRLNRFAPKKLNAQNVKKYFNMVIDHGRQSFRFIILGYVMQEIFPSTLPSAFRLKSKIFTPASLLAAAAVPKKLMPMIAENASLLRIAVKLKSGADVTSDLKTHVDKFSWMNSLCWWEEPFSPDYYLQQARKLIRANPAKILQKERRSRERQSRYARSLQQELKRLYPQAFLYLEMINDMTVMREESWDAVSIAGVRLRPLFRRLSQKHGVSYNQLMMLTIEEILALLKGRLKLDVNELNRRLVKMTIFRRAGVSQVFSGRSAGLDRLAEGGISHVKQIEGLVIWPGRIKGPARVMRSTDDVKKMRTGEILVCPMTDPDYMPAIRIARALVTDQGGVLCHAAIVARELRKICLVGTKIATRVLKDGDMVEVDANKGIVKIISK